MARFKVKEIEARSILTPQKVGSLSTSYDYTINPYAGCAFGCSYCYVPKFPSAKEYEYTDWGKWVEAKINAPELIVRDRLKIFGSRIFFSSATDPYQYIEMEYRLTRRCLQELVRYQPSKLTMHTRSHLMLQDLELLKSFGSSLQVGVSITTDNDDVAREFEPGAPSIRRRLELIRKLREAGIDVYISCAPLLPCDPERLANLLKDYVSRAWVSEMGWIEVNTRPHLLKKYDWWFEETNHKKARETLIAGIKKGSAYPRSRFATAKPKRATNEPDATQLRLAF
jgi:DNA repair photolyase